jgi:nucleoside-diphosphate-sugar epimerase
MTRILLTGTEGFIGSHYRKFLTNLGHDVIAIDKKSGVDLCNWGSVKNLKDVDCVIHLAAFNGTRKFYSQPYDVIRDSVLPTQHLLDRYSGKVDLFVLAGTCESYAGGIDLGIVDVPTPEDVPLVVSDVSNPRWSYGGSKIVNELQVYSAYHQHNQSFQILRYHNVYGPGQQGHFIPEIVQRFKQGDFTVYGSDETRSFCFIDDAVMATYQLMLESGARNQIINVGVNVESTIMDVANIIARELQITQPLIPAGGMKGSVSRRNPDISKLKSLISWVPKTTLTDGIKLTIESC